MKRPAPGPARLASLLLIAFALVGFSRPAVGVGLYWDRDPGPQAAAFGESCLAEEFSVLWWNTLYSGQLSKDLVTQETAPGGPLEANLRRLADRPCLQMIVLSESIPGHLSRKTEDAFRRAFPNQRFFPYNGNVPDFGVRVLSRVPFGAMTDRLDWAPAAAPDDAKRAYRELWRSYDPLDVAAFERTYIRLRVPWRGQDLNVVPIQVLMPWMIIKERHGWFGRLVAGFEVLFGWDNPHAHQMRALKERLRRDFSEGASEALLLVGDFNLPDRIYGVRPRSYVELREGLRPALEKGVPTFPAPSEKRRQDIPEMMIDHAFVNERLRIARAHVLPLQGSDHFALGVTVTHQLVGKESVAALPFSGR